MKNLLLLLFLALMLCGCVTGTTVLIGSPRPETNPEDVELLEEEPVLYEVIGQVTATSRIALSDESAYGNVLVELSVRAASLGANAVILGLSPSPETLVGQAVYVTDFTPKWLAAEVEKKREAKAKAKKAQKAKKEKLAKEQPKEKKTAKNVFVAVVETISSGVTKTNENQYLTNVLREEAVKALPSRRGFTVMTRENISAMLPPDVAIEDCEGSCLVETGRNIAADYIAQARIDTFGENLTISVELYKTSNGRLISSFNAKSPNIDQLESEIRNKAGNMYIEVMKTELGE